MNPILQINKKMLPMKMHFFIGIAGKEIYEKN